MKNYLCKFRNTICTPLLLSFMIFLFGPSEIFFSNVTQFEFLYGEFIYIALGLMLGSCIILSLLISLLPDTAVNYINSILTGIGLASYIQVMFLNKGLDLLGQNPDGYKVETSRIIINVIIWLLIVLALVVLTNKKKDIAKKISLFVPIVLILVQTTGLISLVAQAPKEAYERPTDDWTLSGKDQMVVSSKENVIVIVLDFFSNEYLAPMLEKYPTALDYLHDFTYYSNDNCVYYGTFPSMVHMLTGAHLNSSQGVNEWTKEALTSEHGELIFDTIHKQNYKLNVFTPSSDIYRGSNDITILDGKFDNLSNDTVDVSVNKKLLITTLSKMSAYRMAPEVLKNSFYTNVSECENIVVELNRGRAHNNYDFYNRLLSEGVHTTDDSNLFIIQHLMGDHDRAVTSDCQHNENEDSSLEDNSMGCMVMVKEYLEQLKSVGAYDDSTIIITSDHGSNTEPQVIFFMKQKDETHDDMIENKAPISHCDLLPTVMEAMGADSAPFGRSITEYDEDESIERIFCAHMSDFDYPIVPFYTGEKEGNLNVEYIYKYTGDLNSAKEKISQGPDEIMTLADSFF